MSLWCARVFHILVVLMYILTIALQAQDDAPPQTVAADTTLTNGVCVW